MQNIQLSHYTTIQRDTTTLHTHILNNIYKTANMLQTILTNIRKVFMGENYLLKCKNLPGDAWYCSKHVSDFLKGI